jgi:predicted DNA-binding transcriptional regulator AlpA
MKTQLPVPVVTGKQLCEILDISMATLGRWRKTGAIPQPVRCGRRLLRWRLAEIEKWLEQQTEQE